MSGQPTNKEESLAIAQQWLDYSKSVFGEEQTKALAAAQYWSDFANTLPSSASVVEAPVNEPPVIEPPSPESPAISVQQPLPSQTPLSELPPPSFQTPTAAYSQATPSAEPQNSFIPQPNQTASQQGYPNPQQTFPNPQLAAPTGSGQQYPQYQNQYGYQSSDQSGYPTPQGQYPYNGGYQPQAPKKSGNGLLIAVIALALVVVIGAVFGIGYIISNLGSAPQPNIPTIPSVTSQTTTPPPTTTTPPSSTTTPPSTSKPTDKPLPPINTTVGSAEQAWRSGQSTRKLPNSVITEPYPDRFTASFKTPEDMLHQNPANKHIDVVFTKDKNYNCGLVYYLDAGQAIPKTGSYGCYNFIYGPTLVLYWGEDSTDALREFILAHELSHYLQWSWYFDASYSSYRQGFFSDDRFVKMIETDATCRVMTWGGYDKSIADSSSSPCNIDDWYEGWYLDQAKALGVDVRTYSASE